jgi:hypothetical protein
MDCEFTEYITHMWTAHFIILLLPLYFSFLSFFDGHEVLYNLTLHLSLQEKSMDLVNLQTFMYASVYKHLTSTQAFQGKIVKRQLCHPYWMLGISRTVWTGLCVFSYWVGQRLALLDDVTSQNSIISVSYLRQRVAQLFVIKMQIIPIIYIKMQGIQYSDVNMGQ